MADEKPKLKIAFFGGGQGSGPVFRALAIWKAIVRVNLLDKVDFRAAVYCPGYTHLLQRWGVPTIPDDLHKYSTFPSAEFTLDFMFANWPPDVLISSYIIGGVQKSLDKQDIVSHRNNGKCKAWLLLRDTAPDTHKWLEMFDYDPTLWQGIITIEPTAYEELQAACPPSTAKTVQAVNPIISVYPDEMLPREEARKFLFGLAGIRDFGHPLCVVATNGQAGAEMTSMQQQVGNVLKSIDRPSQIIHLTQNPRANGAFCYMPLALYLNGVDTLISAPGPNMFWEWQALAANRPDAKVAWFPQPRQYDPQQERVQRYGVPGGYFGNKPFKNGADEVVRIVTEGLL